MSVIGFREPTEQEKEIIKHYVKFFNRGSYILSIVILFVTVLLASALIIIILLDSDNIIGKILIVLLILAGFIFMLFQSISALNFLKHASKPQNELPVKIEKIKSPIVAKFKGGKGAHWRLYYRNNYLTLINGNWLSILVTLYKTNPKTELEFEIFRIPDSKTLNFDMPTHNCVVLSIYECYGQSKEKRRKDHIKSILSSCIIVMVIIVLFITWTGELKDIFKSFSWFNFKYFPHVFFSTNAICILLIVLTINAFKKALRIAKQDELELIQTLKKHNITVEN
ncbi:MAG: hypothetical protein IPO21_12630 [Bacteroidales bacterium]|nr:hypothetical protein [Bacteroidales bacterium]